MPPEAKEPAASIDSVNEIGDVTIIFSQDMFLEEIFGEYNFESDTEKEDVVEDEDFYRQL